MFNKKHHFRSLLFYLNFVEIQKETLIVLQGGLLGAPSIFEGLSVSYTVN